MCGVCGVYPFRGHEPVSAETLAAMLASIRHRGPDDEGMHLDADIALGSRRLSIIDLPGGRQPIYNEDRSVAVVFNGEIYNFRELRRQLARCGHTLATAGDTEVIVHLYEDLGEDCVRELRGMFAFALWDLRRKRLLLGRDRLGIKPLYYAVRNGSLIFGSEIKAVLQHPAVDAQPSLEALGYFLSLKYVPAPHTMFEGIQALPPGHLLVCDENGFHHHPYWRLTFGRRADDHRTEPSCVEELAALLRESVALHLVSDVPFGAFLSGGVDSSTIVALMTERLSAPVKTFSVGFAGEGERESELPYARLVSAHCGSDHHEVIVRGQDLIDHAETIVWHLDQPIADPATLANYLVASLARRHVKMVLTGEGGDELFAGYARHAGDRFSPLFRHLPASARRLALAGAARMPGCTRPKIALNALCQSTEVARLVNWFPLFSPDMKRALLTRETAAMLDGSSPEHVFADHLAQTDAIDPLSRMLYLDTSLWLPDDLLARGDKTSMAASIEARVPLLDHRLVEFAAALPPHLKVRGLTRKYLLKKTVRPWLPPEIVQRSKKGFPIPLSIWFRGEARPFLLDILSPSALRRRGLFDPHFVRMLIDRNDRNESDCGPWLWALVGVELWYRRFVDVSPRLAPATVGVAAQP